MTNISGVDGERGFGGQRQRLGRYALGRSVGFRDIVGAAAKDSILATNIKQPLPGRLPFPGKGCGSTTLYSEVSQ